MILSHSIILNLPNKDIKLIEEKSKEAARCWNYCISLVTYACKEYGIWLKDYDMWPYVKGGKFNLPTNIIQGITSKVNAIRRKTVTCKKLGLNIKYPYKTKQYYCLPLKDTSFRKIGNILRITLEKGKYIYVSYPEELDDIPPYGEITYKNGHYVLYYCVKVEEAKPVVSDIKMGIDLGEIHSISATTNEGDALIITNRIGRSYKRYRNKQKRKLQKKMSKCKRGSRRFKRLNKAKQCLQNKTKNKLKNLYHHTTKKAVQFAKEHNVSELICGDCKGVEKNTKKKKRLNRTNRQKMTQMEHGVLTQQLEYKAALSGIKFTLANEAYTSQTCPKCKTLHKASGRTYKCPNCGYTAHRDINGAWNILNKQYKYDIPQFNIIGIHPIKCIS